MFYNHDILGRRGDPFAIIWLVATKQISFLRKNEKHRREVMSVRVSRMCEEIIEHFISRSIKASGYNRPKFSLYLSSMLMYGTVVVHCRQVKMLLDEVSEVFIRLSKYDISERAILDSGVHPYNRVTLTDLPLHLQPDMFFGVLEEFDTLPSVLPATGLLHPSNVSPRCVRPGRRRVCRKRRAPHTEEPDVFPPHIENILRDFEDFDLEYELQPRASIEDITIREPDLLPIRMPEGTETFGGPDLGRIPDDERFLLDQEELDFPVRPMEPPSEPTQVGAEPTEEAEVARRRKPRKSATVPPPVEAEGEPLVPPADGDVQQIAGVSPPVGPEEPQQIIGMSPPTAPGELPAEPMVVDEERSRKKRAPRQEPIESTPKRKRDQVQPTQLFPPAASPQGPERIPSPARAPTPVSEAQPDGSADASLLEIQELDEEAERRPSRRPRRRRTRRRFLIDIETQISLSDLRDQRNNYERNMRCLSPSQDVTDIASRRHEKEEKVMWVVPAHKCPSEELLELYLTCCVVKPTVRESRQVPQQEVPREGEESLHTSSASSGSRKGPIVASTPLTTRPSPVTEVHTSVQSRVSRGRTITDTSGSTIIEPLQTTGIPVPQEPEVIAPATELEGIPEEIAPGIAEITPATEHPGIGEIAPAITEEVPPVAGPSEPTDEAPPSSPPPPRRITQNEILRILKEYHDAGQHLTFRQLFPPESNTKLDAAKGFSILLDLNAQCKVILQQVQPYGDIFIHPREQ